MSIFDAPIARCEAARAMVLMDLTQGECARDHACPKNRQCPLDGCFAEMSGVESTTHEVWPTTPTHH